MPANLENSACGHRTGKGQFSFQSQRKAVTKNVQTTTLISYTSKVMLKILQARLLQQYVNRELPYVQMVLEKAEETEIKLPTSIAS